MMADFIPEEQNFIENVDRKCGLGSCTPNYFQKLANPIIYSFFFCLTGIVQGTYYTYLIGISSTLEKRFSYDTKITGIILLADNISPAAFSIVVGYFAKYIHKPRLVFIGMMINVLACFLACCPFLLFGSEIKLSFFSPQKSIYLCSDAENVENCDKLLWETIGAVCFLFASNFLKGIGSTAYYNVGTAYLDDNVKKRNSPFYLGATYATRILGPSCGLFLSSFCLKYYEDPFIEPDFGTMDSRWIGCWWIGFIIIGVSLFLISFPFLFFPKVLRNRYVPRPKKIRNKSVYDLCLSLKKLMCNPIWLFHTFSIIFQINGIFGYFAFMPRYMENQFQNSASSASFYSGTVTFWATFPVVLFGGFCISRFKPRPKLLTGYMLFTQVFAGGVMIFALFMYCQSTAVTREESFIYHKNEDCNSMCSCDENNFSPICDIYRVNHFSACSAGCHESMNFDKKVTVSNCSCIPVDGNYSEKAMQATQGLCSEYCNKFLPYMISIVISKTFASSARVGSTLVTLRSVDEADKALALGALEFLISLLASIPSPYLYAYFIDKSCLVWKETCKLRGNCLYYDKTLLRYYLHGLSITFIFLGACFDFLVFLQSSKMENFYQECEETNERNIDLLEVDNAN